MISKQIYFLHIPKTSGTSVTAYLDTLFPKKRIFPYQRWDQAFNDKGHKEIKKMLESNNFYLIRGHFGYNKNIFK